MIPLCRPSITKEDLAAVTEALQSGWLAHGPKNREFEQKFSDYIGVKHAITLNSCTSALELAIRVLGIQGDVILPSFSFVASANAIVNAGCSPVFCDIDYSTCNITASELEKCVTDETKAVMVVHFGGCPCNMEEIMAVARKHQLAVIEDSAETIGGEFNGRKAGSFGIGCFSFFPTKNITTGEGGILTTNDDQFARKVRSLAAHGIEKDTLDRQINKFPWYREAKYSGYNYRMSNVLAALGSSQMDRITEFNDKRRALALLYNESLCGVDEIDIPVEPDKHKHVYQMYTIKVDKALRNDLYLSLREKSIEISVHFDPPIHQQSFYCENYPHQNSLAVTDLISNSILTLPLFPDMEERDVEYVCESLIQSLKSIT